ELHLHTNMSAMDALPSAAAVVRRAADFGHRAVAITDHGVVQSYPEARETLLELREKGCDIKVIYGIECYYVDDLIQVVRGRTEALLSDELIVFDLETTGLNAARDRITEIGAVRLKNGEFQGSFSTFVDPETAIPLSNTEITGISDEMVRGAPKEGEALEAFLHFAGGAPLIAHNASFDYAFLHAAAERSSLKLENAVVDTLPLARALVPELSRHRLDTLARRFHINMGSHHRASDDAATLASIWLRLAEMLEQRGVSSLKEINGAARADASRLRPSHMSILVKNMRGLRNLYELITNSHLKHFANKRPRIPLSELQRLREGLLLGSACVEGEVFSALVDGQPTEDVLALAEKYDYFEIMPLCNNAHLLREGRVEDEAGLIELNKKVIEIAERLGKPVVATGDVHFLDERDGIYRKILLSGQGYSDADEQPPLFFRTTDEMLAEFGYLGEEEARRVVIENTNLIADMIEEDIIPVPTETCTPTIEGAEESLREMALEGFERLYGKNPHEAVVARMEKELESIIGKGYAVLYVIAQKLVSHSEEHGYHVGSRGSVGSSFIATLIGVTEVNPLPPHYCCDKCRHFEFVPEAKSGYDLPDKTCPECGARMRSDGQDIPFETFLGFHGEKQPDIDLNFSGEFQQEAHRYTEELFGREHVFKAGTISALQDKKAFGYVKKYCEERGIEANRAELNRLVLGCTGVKQTTGQHPGGMVVVPAGYSINDFTPAQHPADKSESGIVTTHFDFNAMHDTLLKLDELGHDVPTILYYLENLTGVKCGEIPMNDPEVMRLFTSTEPLGLSEEDIFSKTGTYGLPEMGTATVRNILVNSRPEKFSDL
ncbi:MAG: PolC-type DNA polymerase III, partial [Oscillospiraceae bacterium]|nr:PolC-type DNA polymerase III [Oscillospiraceae bacterium]